MSTEVTSAPSATSRPFHRAVEGYGFRIQRIVFAVVELVAINVLIRVFGVWAEVRMWQEVGAHLAFSAVYVVFQAGCGNIRGIRRRDPKYIVRASVMATFWMCVSLVPLAWLRLMPVERIGQLGLATLSAGALGLVMRLVYWAMYPSRRGVEMGRLPKALIVGELNEALRFSEFLLSRPDLGLSVGGLVYTQSDGAQGVQGLLNEIEAALPKEQDWDRIFLIGSEVGPRYAAAVQDLGESRGLVVSWVPPGYREWFVPAQGLIGIPAIPVMLPGPVGGPTYLAIKRFMDLSVSLLALGLASPVMALVALAIKLESRGPAVFVQERRMSEGGRPVRVCKFRTMVLDAERRADELIEHKRKHGPTSRGGDDPRVTRVGRLIRKFSLDELAQLLNVVKGEMSLVGPRPFSQAVFASVDDPFAKSLFRCREFAMPGITGLAQIVGNERLTTEQLLYIDTYYVSHQSLMMDLEIVFRTIFAVLTGRRRGRG